MLIEYDKEADAAYIYLVDIPPGGVKNTYPCDPKEVGGMINLDFSRTEKRLRWPRSRTGWGARLCRK